MHPQAKGLPEAGRDLEQILPEHLLREYGPVSTLTLDL